MNETKLRCNICRKTTCAECLRQAFGYPVLCSKECANAAEKENQDEAAAEKTAEDMYEFLSADDDEEDSYNDTDDPDWASGATDDDADDDDEDGEELWPDSSMEE